MDYFDKETKEILRQELENFIFQKKIELNEIKDPAMAKKFEERMDRMRMQMEKMMKFFEFQSNNEKD